MNSVWQQILDALIPVICLIITAGGAYLVALVKRETNQLQEKLNNEQLNKYMDMAADAVAQSVTYVAQTFVDTLKEQGAFTKEKQIEAFNLAKEKILEILGETVVNALNEAYGDFDTWITTKIEQTCREIKAFAPIPSVTIESTTTESTSAEISE